MNFESASERHTPMSSNETSHFGKPAGRDLPPGTSLNPFASLAASSWANMHLEHLGSLLLTHVTAGPGTYPTLASGSSGLLTPASRRRQQEASTWKKLAASSFTF